MSDHEGSHGDGETFRHEADERLQGAYEPPLSLAEYVDRILSSPELAADAANYLIDAIEASGTRTVIEDGQERTRWRFFDDPHNDGEHAVLGNTATLNAFVDDLRAAAADRGKSEKIVWIDGPTATGKSEFKRCLINGLRAYSQTPEGHRYTLEWNITGAGDDRTLSYGSTDRSQDWYRSPVQIHPLSVFPDQVREDVLEDLNADRDATIDVDTDLDPFSREAYSHLEKRYRSQGRRDLFSAITDPQHLQVSNYVVDVGQGIGVLHAEDDGTPKERLVGSWMPGMLRELDSRGRKNPQAFSYDGVLSQGNGLLSVVEDASQHADLLRRLLNIPDERRVKLDRGIGMDLDTLLIVISNPDLDAELDQFAEREDGDPLKALKRRLTRHEFRYLTNTRLEAELLHRELTGETDVWAVEAAGGELETTEEAARTIDRTGSGYVPSSSDGGESNVDRTRDPVRLAVRDTRGHTTEREIAPHALGAAALYAVVTRLSSEDLPTKLDLVDKARLFERGAIWVDGERCTVDEFDFDDADGRTGIPVTYTRDVIADLLQTDLDRSHPDLPVERVIMPRDALDAMVEGLADAPVFSRSEAAEFDGRVRIVRSAIRERQTADTLEAMLANVGVDEETVGEYVEHVYAWDADEPIETDHGRVAPDALKMKVFETESLGRFDDGDYIGEQPRDRVEEFRRETVIRALTRYAWKHRDDGFSVDDVDLTSIPELQEVLEARDWDDLRRYYPDFDPAEWDDPPADTQTAGLKADTIDRMVDRGYSRASAELTTRAVMRDVRSDWGDV